jgi:hypothetical protein
MGTLMGIVMLVHQVGSFAGVWLGGWAAEVTGSDSLLWSADIVLALCAAALVWPRPARRLVPSAVDRPAANKALSGRLSAVSMPLPWTSPAGR